MIVDAIDYVVMLTTILPTDIWGVAIFSIAYVDFRFLLHKADSSS